MMDMVLRKIMKETLDQTHHLQTYSLEQDHQLFRLRLALSKTYQVKANQELLAVANLDCLLEKAWHHLEKHQQEDRPGDHGGCHCHEAVCLPLPVDIAEHQTN